MTLVLHFNQFETERRQRIGGITYDHDEGDEDAESIAWREWTRAITRGMRRDYWLHDSAIGAEHKMRQKVAVVINHDTGDETP